MNKPMLTIECPKCGDKFTEDWSKTLQYRGLRPGMEWGIDKIRFYCLPIIYCVKCNCKCNVTLNKVVTLQ